MRRPFAPEHRHWRLVAFLGGVALALVLLWKSGSIDPRTEELGPVQAVSGANSDLLSNLRSPLLATEHARTRLEVFERRLSDVRALCEQEGAVHRGGAFDNAITELVTLDAEATARWAQSIEDRSLREGILLLIAQTWANLDAPSALAWAEALPDVSERAQAFANVCLQIAATDPAAAIAAAERVDSSDRWALLQESLVQQWAAVDPASAKEWAQRRPSGAERDNLIGRIAFTISQSNPSEAVEMVAGQMSSGAAQTEAAISVLHQWALRDLDGAGTWVARFPSGPLRDRAERELAGIRRARLSTGAAAWVRPGFGSAVEQ